MTAGLRALLTGIIDYAGLFPPAALPLDQAICNYARYRKEPESWMLGRFICPATKLDELVPYLDLFPDGPLELSVLGRGGESVSLTDTLEKDLAAVERFRSGHAKTVTTDSLEVKVAPLTEIPENFLQFWRKALSAFRQLSIEFARVPQLLPDAALMAQMMGRTAPSELSARIGLKLRCGGLTASAFPSVEQVAFFLSLCASMNWSLKFTAGLHHPIRQFDAGLKVKMHGFVNVFVAGVLARALKLNQAQIQQIIEDEDPASFAFDDAGLRWRDLRASVAEITAARQSFVTSFGSCSFDEPRDDLRALGWL